MGVTFTAAPVPTIVDRTDSNICTVVVAVPGSACDPPGLEGAAHLVEHLSYSASSSLSRVEKQRALAALGESNAYTDNDATLFYVRCLPGKVPEAIALLFDGLRSPWKEEDFEAELKVVAQEMGEWHADPQNVAYDTFTAAAMPVAGRSRIGNLRTLLRINSRDLAAWREGAYSRAVLVVSGKVDFPTVFGALPRGLVCSSVLPETPLSSEFHLDGTRVELRCPSPSACVLAGFPGLNLASERRFTGLVNLASLAIGGGLYSPLLDALRNRESLVYGASLCHNPMARDGVWVCTATCSPENAGRVSELMWEVLSRCQRDFVSDECFLAALNSAIFKISAENELSDRRAGKLLWRYLSGLPVDSLAEAVEPLRSYTIDDAREFMSRVGYRVGLGREVWVLPCS